MYEGIRSKIRDIIAESVPKGTAFDVSVSPRAEMGHFATNAAMQIAKAEKKNPMEVAASLAEKIMKDAPGKFFARAEAAKPGFVNLWLAEDATKKELAGIEKHFKEFGKSEGGKGKTAIVEYSQPNIAKKMHVGHLRTTVIGETLANLHEMLGYKVVRWNYLGDWGTQFGKLIAAYKLWGKKEEVEKEPIQTLLDLYVRFHDELKFRPELEAMGQEEFKKLEAGDGENRKLWEWFKDESLKEFNKMYAALGVKFDVWIGESFFEKELAPLIEELLKNGVAKESEGAVIVPLDEEKLPPAMIRKSDGASVYLTRDIANIRYRMKEYDPAKILYVVGNEQALHFEQLFAIAKRLKLAEGAELAHVKYGLVLAEGGKKFATREGRVVFLEEVIEKAVRLASDVIAEKRPDIEEKERIEIARAVGIGALKYVNLKENRHSDITFDWGRMLDLTGDSAPYLQYSHARLMSVLRKAEHKPKDGASFDALDAEEDFALARKLAEFPDIVREAAARSAPNHLTTYCYELANVISAWYELHPIITDENKERKESRLALAALSAGTLKKGLEALGITALEKM